MEIEENPKTFSVLVTEQELTALSKAVESWIENATGEDPAGIAEDRPGHARAAQGRP